MITAFSGPRLSVAVAKAGALLFFSLSLAGTVAAAPAPTSSQPRPPAATTPLFAGGNLFLEAQAWKAAYAQWRKPTGPQALQVFLSRFPRSLYCDDALYYLGKSFQQQKLYPEAMAAWRKLVDVYPQSSLADDAAWSLAAQCLANHDYAAAIQVYKFFVNSFPANPLADDACYNISRYSRYLKDKVQAQALRTQAYQSLAANYPSSDMLGSALYQVITGLYRARQYEACVALCQTFLQQQPCHDYADEMQYQIIMCYYGAKRYDLALPEIARLRAMFPGSSYIDTVARYEDLMRAHQMKAPQQFDPEAELEAREANRGRRRHHRRRARRLYTPKMAGGAGLPTQDEITAKDLTDAAISARNARAWQRALLCYQLILDHFRGDSYWDDALYNMAYVYELAGDKARAVQVYRRVYTTMIGSDWQDDALWKIAQLYKEAGLDAQMYQVYHEIVQEVPFSRYADSALRALVKHYFDTRDVQNLLGIYQLIITRFPGHDLWPEAAFQTGCLQMMYRNYRKARDAFKLLLNTHPTNDLAVPAAYLLAECYWRGGQPEFAEKRYQDLLNRWPTQGLTDDVQQRLAQLATLVAGKNRRSTGRKDTSDATADNAAGAAGGDRQTQPTHRAKTTAQAGKQSPGARAAALAPADKPTETPPAPDPHSRLAPAKPQTQPSFTGLQWKKCKKTILEQFPDGLRGPADPTAPGSRNPLHILFSAKAKKPVFLIIRWITASPATFAVNIFMNGKAVGTAWPDTKQPTIAQIPKWMVHRGRNHLVLYAPMDSGQWDYFALVGDAVGQPEPTPSTTTQSAARMASSGTPPQSYQDRLAALYKSATDPFSDYWRGRRLVLGRKDARSTEFNRSNPGNYVEWWVDLDNNQYASRPDTAYKALTESLVRDADQAATLLSQAGNFFIAGQYSKAAPLYAALAYTKKVPADIRRRARELVRVTQEFIKRPAYEAITTEHFHLLAPLETTVILREYDIPQLWEAAYRLLARWVGDVPYGGDRLVVVYDPDFSSYRSGNPIRISTRYAQSPPQWDPMFTCLAQDFFYTPAVYTALAHNYYLSSALAAFAAWRLPEALLPACLPANHARTIASQCSKSMEGCDLYVGRGADIKRFNSTVASGLLLELAALANTGKPKPGDTSWQPWERFCQLAQAEAPALAQLRKTDEQWAVFRYFAARAFGKKASALLDRCGIPASKTAAAAVQKALEKAKPSQPKKQA